MIRKEKPKKKHVDFYAEEEVWELAKQKHSPVSPKINMFLRHLTGLREEKINEAITHCFICKEQHKKEELFKISFLKNRGFYNKRFFYFACPKCLSKYDAKLNERGRICYKGDYYPVDNWKYRFSRALKYEKEITELGGKPFSSAAISKYEFSVSGNYSTELLEKALKRKFLRKIEDSGKGFMVLSLSFCYNLFNGKIVL